jgi:hypothetical protein
MAKQISSSKMQGRADFRSIQNLSEPMHLFGRLKKWVFPINGCVLPIHDIIDYSNRIGCRIPDLPNMQRNELQVMRIDVAGVDEALGFLGTTAGIVRVHQAALVVHELVEVPAGAREALPEIVGRHLQDFATDGVARSEDFSEREDQSLLAVQTEQHSGCACDFGLFHQ